MQSPQRLLLPRPVQPCRGRQPNDSALGRCFQCGSSGCLLGQVDTLGTFRTRDCYIPRPWQGSISYIPIFHAYIRGVIRIILWCKGEEVSMGNLEVFEYDTLTFLALSSGQAEITDNDVAVLERFTIAILTVRGTYQIRLSSKGAVHQEGKSYHHGCLPSHQQKVPWWSTSREQSTRGHCLVQATAVAQKLSPPNDWAWTEPPNWKQLWTTLSESSTSTRELISCGCEQGCRGQCKCNKAALKCTALFQCCGQDCDA